MIAEVTISSDVCFSVPQRPDVSPVPGSVSFFTPGIIRHGRITASDWLMKASKGCCHARQKTHISAIDLSHRVRTYLFDRNALIRGRW